jgi:DNA-binding CsgD family transcriptional regulator
MDLLKFNKEAIKIWKRFASQDSPTRLHLDLGSYKKFMDFVQVGDSYYFIFNFDTCKFDMVSPEVETVLGYTPNEMEIPFVMDKMHPDDRPWFLAFEASVVKFFSDLPIEKLMKYKVRYDFRLKKSNGAYIRLLHQVVVAEHDTSGRAYRTLGLHTDITYLKSDGRPVLSFVGLDGEPTFVDVQADNTYLESRINLTRREREVVRLIAEGKLSKQIADVLSISKLTVDSHRKNILRKHGLSNTSELLGKALQYGWI